MSKTLILPIALTAGCSVFADDLFDLSLEQLLQVTVASNVTTNANTQPNSVYIVSKNVIRNSGASTLNELLSLYVPGYFMVQDQDDIIAGFRGMVPDNNSKILLLINGVNVNSEWFWGPPDAILNGLDLHFIERIEVIRGPGSVVLGQGALFGAINIITVTESAHSEVSLQAGGNQLMKSSIVSTHSFTDSELSVYISRGHYDGSTLNEEGWTAARSDQGLTIAARKHRINRGEYSHFISKFSLPNWTFDAFRFEQQRDLYNFYRDREVVEQRLDGLSARYETKVFDDWTLQVTPKMMIDSYALYSHGGNTESIERETFENSQSVFSNIANQIPGLANARVESGTVMGGTREKRQGIKVVANRSFSNEQFKLAVGAEWNQFQMGLKNHYGNNYIINENIQTLGIQADAQGNLIAGVPLNSANTWVKPHQFAMKSVFIENVFKPSDTMDWFFALRWDDHPSWGNHLSPRIGTIYTINPQHRLRFSWQKGFRGAVGLQYTGGFVQDGFLAESNFPVVNSLSTTVVDFNFDGIASNDDGQLNAVKPETIDSLEVEHRWNEDRWSVNTIFFYNILDDIIAAQAHGYEGLGYGEAIGTDTIGTWGGNWYFQNQNGDLKQFGLEIEASYEDETIQWFASHSYVGLNAVSDDAIGIYTVGDKHFAAYPEHVTRVSMHYKWSSDSARWLFSFSDMYYWSFHSPSNSKEDGGHVVNSSVTYAPNQFNNVSLQWVVKNLFDTQSLYPINGTGDLTGANGTPSLEGRTFFIGVNYRFK